MIYYLYGPDSLRRKRRLAELFSALRNRVSSTEEIEVDLEENPDAWRDVKDFINQQSIFGGTKVAVVRNVTESGEKEWTKFLKDKVADDSVFIFGLDEKKPVKAFDFLLKKSAVSDEFKELAGRELASFIVDEAKARNFSFSPEALKFFVSFLENQKEGRSWIAVNEIEKFGFLGKSVLSVQDLSAASSFPEFDEVWLMTRRILGAERAAEKVAALEKLFMEGADPSYIFNSLAFSATGSSLLKLADLDISIKSGKLDFPEALLGFVLGA